MPLAPLNSVAQLPTKTEYLLRGLNTDPADFLTAAFLDRKYPKRTTLKGRDVRTKIKAGITIPELIGIFAMIGVLCAAITPHLLEIREASSLSKLRFNLE